MSDEKKQRGRPKKLELMTIQETMEMVKEYYQGKITVARGTLYNKISAGVLTNHGKKHCALLDKDEVFEKLCS